MTQKEPRIYLDHAATSPLLVVAKQAMLAAMDVGGNPSSTHASGRKAKSAYEDAREEIAARLGAHPSELVFTSGGSEADSIAVLGSMRAISKPALVAATEHPAVLGARQHGALVLPVDSHGLVRLDADFAGHSVVSVMAVNNETGVIQPLAAVAEKARAAGAWVHSDAVQAIGHVDFDFGESGLDLASVSAHKIGGPIGIGALLVRKQLKPHAIGLGGGQERELRSGTQSVVLAAGFAAALAASHPSQAQYRAWQHRVVEAAVSLPEVFAVSQASPTAGHIAHITFNGLRADDLLLLLDEAGVDASVGSACRAGVHQPSEVLLAMGRSEHEALASVRFSFGHSTTDGDIDYLVGVLPEAVARARRAFDG